MKLLSKTTLLFLTLALFVLFTGSIILYFSLRYFVNKGIRTELITEMHQIIMDPPYNILFEADTVLSNLPSHYRIVNLKVIRQPFFVFSDTILYDKITGRYQSYIVMNYETSIYEKPVRISIFKSLYISDKLNEYILLLTLMLSLILLIGLSFLNNYFFSHLWKNFFQTLEIIKNYSIENTKEITFPESEITEFNMLNQRFRKMHERIRMDYQNLKEFLENVSHEIQNPLAIINSKADLLQQNSNLDESQAALINSIRTSASRLSNLNKSLILLSKIDNNQFPEREEVNIVNLIEMHIENFRDFILSRQITLNKTYRHQITIMADPSLISIMLLNILKNSIFHNIESGSLEIIAENSALTIRNTGRKPVFNQEDIFKRFVKSSTRSESLGLGLAIVKKICDYYQFEINYSFSDNIHSISILFTDGKSLS